MSSSPVQEPDLGAASAPRVVSVNVGAPAAIAGAGQQAVSAIGKTPVAGPVAARGVNLAGDDQANRDAHGGPDKAVYAYAAEDYRWWSAELGRTLRPGTFGENLTTAGMCLAAALIGERWRVGTVLLEVAGPRIPCYKLGIRLDDATFPRCFLRAGRSGAYLRIVGAGELAAGQPIEVLSRPEHGLTVGEVTTIYATERHRAGRLLDAPELPAAWRDWAVDRLAGQAPPSRSGA